jgi:DNA mismatch repair protein MutL
MKIRPLSPDVKAKIAAGEVVDRPASVVKELVENAIDAGSKRIVVEVKDGGKSEIKVVDDGCGIPADDTERAFDRYSTSKISTLEDLEKLMTLGFRGEALASIAAAAGEVELITRSVQEGAGTRIRITDGKIAEKTEVGAPQGTTVIVRNLFERIPARKKFMKNRTVEMSHVTETVVREAFACPDVAIGLAHDGAQIFATSGKGLQEAISTIYGSSIARGIIPLDHEAKGLRLSGYISSPPEFRRTGNFMTLIVNGRYVESAWMRTAVKLGYKDIIPEGFFPIAVLRIDLDPAEVDVNIHPRKLEVKVSDDVGVTIAIRDAIWDAITRRRTENQFRNASALEKAEGARGTVSPTLDGTAARADTFGATSYPPDAWPSTTAAVPEPSFWVLGQVFDTFMIIVKGNELLIVDQHVAHERVLYERLRESGEVSAQRVLVPFVVDLSPQDIITFQSYREALGKLGFGFEEFGERSVRVTSVPNVLSGPVNKEMIEKMLDDLSEGGKSKDIEDALDRVRKVAACRGAIMAGDRISPGFFHAIFKELLKAKDPYKCPHGRPIVISMKREKLEREFGR